MGTFRCGLLLAVCLLAAGPSLAQNANPAVPGAPVPAPDTNTQVAPPVIAPETDPTALTAPPIGVADPATGIAAPISAPAPKAAPKPKKVAPALPTVRGTAAKLDTIGMTLTVDAKGKEETFMITSKTRVFADNKPAILSDAKPGENVLVEYRNNKDKSKDALTLKFGGPAASVSKSATDTSAKKPTVKKPKKTKKPGTAKHAHPHTDTAPAAGTMPAPVDTAAPVTTPIPAPTPGATPLPPGPTPQ